MLVTRHHIFVFQFSPQLPLPPVPVPPIPAAVGFGEIVDYIFKFNDVASPQHDSITGLYFTTPFSGLSLNVLIFDRSSTNSTIPLSGNWFMITKAVLDSQLLNHPNCLLAINRSEQIKGRPAIVKNLVDNAAQLSIMISGIGAHTSQGLLGAAPEVTPPIPPRLGPEFSHAFGPAYNGYFNQ